MTSDTPSPYDDRTVLTIAQRCRGAAWRLSLAHARSSHLVIWVTRGAARAVVEGRAQTMSSHNVLIIPAGTLFSFTYEPTCFGQTLEIAPDPALQWPEEPTLLRVREPKSQLALTGHIEAVQTEALAGQSMHAEAIRAHTQLMLVWASRYQDTHAPHQTPTAAQRLLKAFCALVVQSEHTDQNGASMAEFAARLGVTPTHLARVCKAECGMTAADILTQHSLQQARRLLEETTLPANRIAERLGFSSAAYFTRFIQAHTGQTPTALRNSAA